MRLGKAFALFFFLFLAGIAAYLSPIAPILSRWGAWPKMPSQPVNYLIAGVTPKYLGYHRAAPEDYSGLTDTLFIVRLEPTSQTIRLLSVPRDTRVNVSGYGWGKINGANVHGGPQVLVSTLESLTGLKLEGYAYLSLEALRDVTDALGGVQVNVPFAMKYQDTAAKLSIDLEPGLQTLNGVQLEGFTRFRHDGMGDIGRVARQQDMLRAVSAKLHTPQGIVNLPKAASALEKNVRTDLERDDVAALLGMMLNQSKLETYTVPGDFAYFGGRSYWEADQNALQTLLKEKF